MSVSITVNIGGIPVPAEVEEFSSANTLRVTAGTNCLKGGDSGHGGRTILILDGSGNTDIHFSVNGDRVKVVLGGDTECETLIDGLEFAAKTLRRLKK